MRTLIPNILAAAQQTPWAILPTKLDEIAQLFALRAAGRELTREEIAARTGEGRRSAPGSPTNADGKAIAVIPVYGTISHRQRMVDDISGPGGTSTEQLGQQFERALADSNIGAIVFDVDSPGGTVTGVMELADQIFAARGKKPIKAVANGLAASAAYWIASACDELIVAPSGRVGSVGVYMMHVDVSGALAQDGLAPTLISAGKYKVEANPYGPLTDDAKAQLQQNVDDCYEQFVGAVARQRGATPSAVRDGYGQGRVLDAQPARAANLVDRIATLDEVLAQLGAPAGARHAASRRAADDGAIPHADADGAASAVSSTSLEPAPQGRSVPVKLDQDTAPPKGAANDVPPAGASHDTALSANEARIARLTEIAELTGSDQLLAGWIRGNTTPQAAREEAMSGRRGSARPAVTGVHNREQDRPWDSMGAFFLAVHQAHPQVQGPTDPRLFATATGMNQAVPSEGGFTVPGQISNEIWDGMNQEVDALLPMTDQRTVEGEFLELLANAETTRQRGGLYGGVQAFWINEADQLTKSKPKFRKVRVEPQQLAVLVYATEKVLRNSPVALQQHIAKAAPAAINFEVGDAVIRGAGAGLPKGILPSQSLITVSKETSQASGTVVQENIAKMWARLHPASRKRAVWLHNVDVEPQFDLLNSTVKTVAGTENVGGYANKVFDAEKRTLKGRPIIACEFCESVGTTGDLILWDPMGYLAGIRGTGIQEAMSMHVRFEYAEQAFRFMFEADGQPWLEKPITPYKGANTLSTHIALQTR